MAFDSLDKLFNVILSQPQWQEQKRYCELKKCWYKIINHKVAQHTRPVSIKNEVLYIATSNAVWAQELSLQRPNLIRKMNRRLEIPVENLHFASMKWHNNYLISANIEDFSQENHPSLVNPSADIAHPCNTPQEALEQWLQQIKNRASDWQTCPRCATFCPEGELKRWGVCRICFRNSNQ